MLNFSPLAAEIGLPVLGIPANFNGFRLLAGLLHGSQVVSVSQTVRRLTEGATYVRQGDHHVGHWPTFLDDIVHEFGEITQNKGYYTPFKVIQGHRFWYKSTFY